LKRKISKECEKKDVLYELNKFKNLNFKSHFEKEDFKGM
jgi:hypothetical protein